MNEREKWLQARRLGIGGSDSPALLLENHYRNRRDVAIDKLGGPPLADNADLKRGRYLEPIVADMYAELADCTLHKIPPTDLPLKHPEFHFLLASPDYEIIGDPRGPGILEIKCPRVGGFKKAQREGIPLHYKIQLQHYLLWPKYKWGVIAVFNSELWEILIQEYEPDKALQEEIVKRASDFWAEFVLSGHLPDDDGEPFEFPDTDGEISINNDPEWIKGLTELSEARTMLDDCEEIHEAAKEKIMEIMALAEVMEGGSSDIYARIVWKTQQGRLTLDKKYLAADNPELDISKYEKRGKPSRPFRPYYKIGG